MSAGVLHKTRVFLESIKVSHSIFALPFAISAAFLAGPGLPSMGILLKLVLAVVFARTAAMAFNRWADSDQDARNPRTRMRAIPAGLLKRGALGIAAAIACGAFVLVCATINSLALILSPVVLIVLLGYSYTKRFTALSHFALGAALGLSPLGAWVAVREEVALLPGLLGLAVLFWTAGFDIIYACQDYEFDRKEGLHSLPVLLGTRGALRISRTCHILAVTHLVAVGWIGAPGLPYAAGVVVVAVLLGYEQSLVSANDLSRVNLAFFTLNGLVSLVFMAGVVLQTVI